MTKFGRKFRFIRFKHRNFHIGLEIRREYYDIPPSWIIGIHLTFVSIGLRWRKLDHYELKQNAR